MLYSQIKSLRVTSNYAVENIFLTA